MKHVPPPRDNPAASQVYDIIDYVLHLLKYNRSPDPPMESDDLEVSGRPEKFSIVIIAICIP
jgi:hypothetical protein